MPIAIDPNTGEQYFEFAPGDLQDQVAAAAPTKTQQKQDKLAARTQEKQATIDDVYIKGMQQRFDALAQLNTQNVDLISRTSNADGTGNIFGEDKPLGLNVERATTGGYGAYGRPLSDTRGIGGDSIYDTLNNPTDDSDYHSKYGDGTIPTNFQPAVLDKVVDADSFKFRGVTGGAGKYGNLTGILTDDRQVGIDAFEVPHEGFDYVNTPAGKKKIARQLDVLNGGNGYGGEVGDVQGFQTLGANETLQFDDNGEASTGAVEGAIRAGAGGLLNVASSISSAPEKLYEFLGGDYLEDDSIYSKAVKGIITTMDEGGKLIEQFNNNYVDIDKSKRDAFEKDVGKSFDDGNYITGVLSAVANNPMGAVEFGFSSYAFSKALTSKGISKIPGLLGSTMDNTDEARKEFIKVNGREPDASEKGVIMTLSAVSTAVDSAAASIVFKGLGGNKVTAGLSKVVDTAIDKLPAQTLQKFITKPMIRVLSGMTVEGIQEGPLQEGLKQLAANQNDVSKITDPEVLKAIYVNGVIGAVSAPGMHAADVGARLGKSAVSVVTGDGVKNAYNTAKEKVSNAVNDVADIPTDMVQGAEANDEQATKEAYDEGASPLTASLKDMTATEAGDAINKASKQIMQDMKKSPLSEEEYMAENGHKINDLEQAYHVHRQKIADEAVATGNTDTLGATPEEEEAIYAAYAMTDDEHAKTFKDNMLARLDPAHESHDKDIGNVMERADEIREAYQSLKGINSTREEVISKGMDDERKGAHQYFRDALRAPVGSAARQEGVSKLLNLNTIEEKKMGKLTTELNGVVDEVGKKVNDILLKANKALKSESKPPITKVQVWKAMVAATHAAGDHLANDHAYRDDKELLNSVGIDDNTLSQVGEYTASKYASKNNIKQNKGFGRKAGEFEINHSGALVDYANAEGFSKDDMYAINNTFRSGSSVNKVIRSISDEIGTINKAISLIDKNTKRSSGTSPKGSTEAVKEETPASSTNAPVESKVASEAATVSPTLSSSIDVANSIQGTNVEALNAVQKAQYEEVQQAVKDGTVVANTVEGKTTYSMAPTKPVETQTPGEQPSNSGESAGPSESSYTQQSNNDVVDDDKQLDNAIEWWNDRSNSQQASQDFLNDSRHRLLVKAKKDGKVIRRVVSTTDLGDDKTIFERVTTDPIEDIVVEDEDKGLTVADILSLTKEAYLVMHVDEYKAIGKRIGELNKNAVKGSREHKDLAESYKLYTKIGTDIKGGEFKGTPLADSINDSSKKKKPKRSKEEQEALRKIAREHGEGVVDIIDLERSGLDGIPPVKSARILEDRGYNRHGVQVGTIRVVFEDGSIVSEVFFKKGVETKINALKDSKTITKESLYDKNGNPLNKNNEEDLKNNHTSNTTNGEEVEYSDNVKEAITSLIKNNKAILAFIKKNVPDYNEDEGCN